MKKEGFHEKLQRLIVEYIRLGSLVLNTFPKEEMYGMTSQCKRSLVSVFLNYTEAYARVQKGVMRNLYEVSYGSLQESIATFYLAVQLHFISKDEYTPLFQRKEEIGKMLWKTIEGVKKDSR